MSLSGKNSDRKPTELELLLPFYANGTLGARDARRVEDALARDPDLARQFKDVQSEYSETIALNETIGAPSSRALHKLLAAIEAEPQRKPVRSVNPVRHVADFLSRLSALTLAYFAVTAVAVVLVQAGVIGMALRNRGPIQTASYETKSSGTHILLRFAPDASIVDISQLLTFYNAKIISGPDAGMFRIRVGDIELSKEETAQLIAKLQNAKIVSLVMPAE